MGDGDGDGDVAGEGEGEGEERGEGEGDGDERAGEGAGEGVGEGCGELAACKGLRSWNCSRPLVSDALEAGAPQLHSTSRATLTSDSVPARMVVSLSGVVDRACLLLVHAREAKAGECALVIGNEAVEGMGRGPQMQQGVSPHPLHSAA